MGTRASVVASVEGWMVGEMRGTRAEDAPFVGMTYAGVLCCVVCGGAPTPPPPPPAAVLVVPPVTAAIVFNGIGVACLG